MDELDVEELDTLAELDELTEDTDIDDADLELLLDRDASAVDDELSEELELLDADIEEALIDDTLFVELDEELDHEAATVLLLDSLLGLLLDTLADETDFDEDELLLLTLEEIDEDELTLLAVVLLVLILL